MDEVCAWCRRPNPNPDRSVCNSCYPSDWELAHGQESERLKAKSEAKSHAMQEALTTANLILEKWDEWEQEAGQAAQVEQSHNAYEAVMREHLADVIHAAIERVKP